jgi:hypothetical protein
VHARSSNEHGWNNLYTRRENIGRNVPAERLHAANIAGVATGSHGDVFAGRDGSVFRRTNSGWEQYQSAGHTWSGMDRVPEAYPAYRSTPAATYSHSFERPESGLEQHYAARSVGNYRAATVHSFSGGGFRGGGGGGHR